MFRREIVNLFYQNLKIDPNGRYVIEMENDRCFVEVEDKAFVIRAVYNMEAENQGADAIQVMLSDDTREYLNPESLWVGKDHVLYCSVKENQFDARFCRASYYQLAEFVQYDETNEQFYLPMNGQKYYLIQKMT